MTTTAGLTVYMAQSVAAVPAVPYQTSAVVYYGKDLSCVTDFAVDGRTVDPASGLGVAQAVVRRLITPRGALLDDQRYGYDLRGALAQPTALTSPNTIELAAQLEIGEDERVAASTVDITIDYGPPLRLTASIVLWLKNQNGPFRFVFAVTPDSAELLETIDV